nr:phage tail tape measure protein [Clostridium niameyense]
MKDLSKEVKDQLSKVASETEKVKTKTEEVGEGAKKTKGVFAKFKDALKGTAEKLKEIGDKTEEVGEKSQKSENGLKTFGKAVAGAFVTKKIIDFGKSSANVYGEFQQSMANVKATMELSGAEGEKQYKKLWTAAKKAGAETRYSATQGANALYFLASSGYDTDKAISTLPNLLNLASAGGLELDRATELTTQSMAALRLETQELPTFLDQLTKAAHKANTDIDKMGEGILVCGGVARNFGMDTADLNTQLAILADAGYQGAKGGTALRNTLLNLTGNDKVNDLLKEMGVNVTDNNGKFKKFNDIMVDLKSKLQEYTPAQQEAIKATIGGKENVQGLNILLDGAGDKYGRLREEIVNSTGAAKEAADVQNDTVKGAFDNLTSAIEDAQISMFDSTTAGDGLKQAFKDIAAAIPDAKNELQYFMDKFGEATSFILENRDLILPAIAAIVVSVGTLKIIEGVTTLYEAWKNATEGVSLAQGILNIVLGENPILGVITLVISLVTFLVVLYNTSDEARYKMQTFFVMIQNIGIKSLNDLIDVVNLAIGGLNKLIGLVNKIPGIDIGPIEKIGKIAYKELPKAPDKKSGKPKQKAARGTHNAIGGPTLVGEQGPEIVNLNRGDTVTPNNTTRRLANQGNISAAPSVNLTVNIHDSGNPQATGRAVADIVRKEIESVFGTTSLQLGYTDV